jgi:hypothetical protein
MLIVHFEYRKNHSNKSIRVCLYVFWRAFQGASFKRKTRFYHLLKPRYIRNKKCCNLFCTSSVSAVVTKRQKIHKTKKNILLIVFYITISQSKRFGWFQIEPKSNPNIKHQIQIQTQKLDPKSTPYLTNPKPIPNQIQIEIQIETMR